MKGRKTQMSKFVSNVYLEKKKVGEIRRLGDNQFQYWPEGKKKYANPEDIFSTVDEVLEHIV